MKKLLLIILSIFIMVWTASAGEFILQERVINHPDATQIGEGWYRVVIKENLSETEYDWRFDMRVIETDGYSINIVHREEQNSGQHPDSNWVIEYAFVDKFSDGTLDYYDKERFMSVQGKSGGWFRISVTWPDLFRYPDLLTEEEALELYKKELEWWDNKL